ncbi:MAG: methyltransferase domain-containing protein [bacterium]
MSNRLSKNYLLWNSDESSILISTRTNIKHISTHKGKIELNYPLEYGATIISSTNKKYYVLIPTHQDINVKLNRTTNTFTVKDLSLILGFTSLTKDSVVLEIGVGSGAGSIFLSNFVKKVVSIDNNFYNISNAKQNIHKFAKQENVVITLSNEKHLIFKNNTFDCVIIDIAEPQVYCELCNFALKPGGDLVFAVPNIEQVKEARKVFAKSGFIYFRTVEIWLRKWIVRENYSRPEHELQSHSMFLTFCKKIK